MILTAYIVSEKNDSEGCFQLSFNPFITEKNELYTTYCGAYRQRCPSSKIFQLFICLQNHDDTSKHNKKVFCNLIHRSDESSDNQEKEIKFLKNFNYPSGSGKHSIFSPTFLVWFFKLENKYEYDAERVEVNNIFGYTNPRVFRTSRQYVNIRETNGPNCLNELNFDFKFKINDFKNKNSSNQTDERFKPKESPNNSYEFTENLKDLCEKQTSTTLYQNIFNKCLSLVDNLDELAAFRSNSNEYVKVDDYSSPDTMLEVSKH
ncbi:hypothetical protein RF11_01677 [Thelohanellus kitauei]|uniref:Uncharacterized protein n=1 Tax=Thelohanellus kitauei TaxID=669202 RepID=A0A0C2M4C4_THEKT|nr:hypothetical protein RF11_01677 [Thelohanellus kitauei]